VIHVRAREHPDDDALLVVRVSEGDAEAYRELVVRHAEPLHHFTLRLLQNDADAEDIVQDTFLRLWLRASEYVPTGRVTTWLHRIAHNLAMDRLRGRQQFDSLDDNFELSSSNSASQPNLLDAKRDAEALYRALDVLPVRQTAALVLVHLNGLSGKEACEVLGVTETLLESLLARGRRNLKVRMAGASLTNSGGSR
jgi:RNA polymerase sigma-70 factor (ECF subfamily)